MLRKLMLLAVATASSYLFIQWLPVPKPISLAHIILALVMDPLHYFVAMVAFFLAFLSHSILIKSVVEETYSFMKGRQVRWGEAVICYGAACSFWFLWQAGQWQTILILCFSIVYGMISVDLRRNQVVDTHY
ncbi:hypothetical protein ACFOU2_04260 [Bacillus songklensis]|uniref:Uncharacterized protein n=1 Tax=Bacillus songklensis TaxID=1069116 RepID=A0ABV8AXR0_9BACI